MDCLTCADHATLRKWYRHIDAMSSCKKNMSKMIEGTDAFDHYVEFPFVFDSVLLKGKGNNKICSPQDPKVSRVTKPDCNNTCTSVLLHTTTK